MFESQSKVVLRKLPQSLGLTQDREGVILERESVCVGVREKERERETVRERMREKSCDERENSFEFISRQKNRRQKKILEKNVSFFQVGGDAKQFFLPQLIFRCRTRITNKME